MESPLRKQIRSIMKDHKKRQVWYRIVTTLAVVVVFVTTYMLILPAITMENKAQCGITEHKHDANCYSTQYEKEKVLSCTTESLGVHKHTDACYDAEHKLVCGYADFVIHKHDASCYDADGNLVCELPEHTLHVHTAECYRTEQQLVCTQEESAGHTHTAECYTKTQGNLICGKEEHTHGEGCYDADGNLVCEKEEHTHTDECYEWNDVLNCTIPESAGHTHDASCYQNVQVLVCEEPVELHTHTDACYKDGVRICDKLELKEHQHTDACFKDEDVLVQTLVCDRVEHVHTDECYKGSGQETEEQSSVVSEEVTSEEVTSGQSEEESSSEAVIGEELSSEAITEEASSEEASNEAITEAETEEASSEQIEETSTEEVSTEESLEEASTEEISTEEISSEEESSEEVSEEEESTEEVSSEAETEEESSEEASTEEIETEETKESFDMWDLSVDGVLFIAYSDDITAASENEEDFTSNESDIALYTAENNAIQLYAASAEPSGTNFRDFITSAEVQKIVNGKWQDATEFENGDDVKVKLTYTLPEGTVTPNNKSIWYQLPNAVVPNKDLSGIVYDKSNNPIGTYSIGTNGMIQITFYNEFATGKEIAGDIFFSGKVESDNTKEDKKIEFGGSAATITIKKEKEEEVKTDIKIKKEGTLSDSKDKISYKVTISSSLGTGEKVKLDDYLTNGTYIEDSITVTKVTKSESDEVSSDQYELLIDNNSDQRTLKISELPELKAGESYEITYDVTPGKRSANGELKVDNIASTNKNQNDYWSQTVKKTLISKSGKYDSDKNVITWTVTINPDGTDLKGYIISDRLDGTDLTGHEATLKYSDGNTEKITLPYTFTESTTREVSYEITYETDVDLNKPSGNVKNDATIEKDGDKYEAGSEVGYTHRDWDLQKYSDGSEKVKGQDKMIYKWKSTITLPDKNLSDLGEFTYEDTIGESEMHSASKSELESKLMQEIEFTYIDENGNKNTVPGAEIGNYFTYQIIYTPENVDAVSGFNIVFTPKPNLKIKGKEIVLKYYTNADLSKVQPGSSTTFTNTAKVKDIKKKASVDYKKPIKIQKASSSEGALKPPTTGNNIYWETGNKYRGYMNSQVERKLGEDGYLYYRLILNLEEAEDIKLDDLLPIGTTYVEDSAFAAYCELNSYGTIEAIKYTGDPIKVEAFTNKKQTTEDNESYQELKLKLTNIRRDPLLNNNGYIVVYYTVKVEDSAFGSDGKASLTNTATWKGETVENTTNVKKYEKIIEKSGKQVVDSGGKPLDAIEYRVVINPGASDLDVEKDTVTLVDTISYTKLYSVSLNLDTVKLYHYDSTKKTMCGEEISPTRYQVRYDSDAGKMTVVLPDQLACVLVYQYNYDKGDLADFNGASVSNSVKLMGESSKSDITSLKVNDSGATAHQNIEIYKVDSTDFTKKLAGAKFDLEIWKNQKWQNIGKYISGDGTNGTKLGEIELRIDSDNKFTDGEIWKNYIYRLTETEAPVGYAKRSEPYYFVRTNGEVRDSKDYYDLEEAIKKSIHKISISGENIYIPNVASGLNVRKVWVNSDGSQISDPTGSIQVQLYKSKGTIDGINVTVKWNEGSAQETIFIKRGSALIIRTALDYNIQYYSCNDENVVIKEYNSENNQRFLTVDGITKDCTINIKRWNVYPTFEYTEATDVTYNNPEKVGNPVTLNASNNWSHEWSNLNVGDGIYYYVEEVGTHSGYTVSYMNNGGIHSGEIVITNRMDEKPITLPETGGTGTYWYTLGGLLLIAGASLLMYRNSMRKGGKRNW